MHFATSNEDKFREVQRFLPDISQLDVDLIEIQHADHDTVVRDKVRRAADHATPIFVEDTALHLDCLDGLPGPFIKWFLDRIGLDGLYELCDRYDTYTAQAVTKIAYSDGDSITTFTGTVEGTIVEPTGDGFGWDPIFQPEDFDETYAEMGEGKHEMSHRRRALDAFISSLSD
ncbi:MAG: non-canonical purine NTP pyrophosphatase [Halobacteriaceae archaeon]